MTVDRGERIWEASAEETGKRKLRKPVSGVWTLSRETLGFMPEGIKTAFRKVTWAAG